MGLFAGSDCASSDHASTATLMSSMDPAFLNRAADALPRFARYLVRSGPPFGTEGTECSDCPACSAEIKPAICILPNCASTVGPDESDRKGLALARLLLEQIWLPYFHCLPFY